MEKAPDIEDEVPDHELLEMETRKLKKVLGEMHEGDREILLMKYQHELSIKEIADMLDKSESAVKMRIKRAKSKAQQMKKDMFKEEE
jgi:RNA polymerase sigma-70 factor (ECF subfamily)